MDKIQIGRPYPEALEIRDGMAIQPMSFGLLCLIHVSRFELGDRRAFGGPVSIAALELEPGWPWVALRFHQNRLTLDAPVLVGHRPDLQAFLESSKNALQLVITEGLRHKVRKIRLLGLSDDMLKLIKTAQKQPNHMGTVSAKLLAGQQRWPDSSAVYEAAKIKQRLG